MDLSIWGLGVLWGSWKHPTHAYIICIWSTKGVRFGQETKNPKLSLLTLVESLACILQASDFLTLEMGFSCISQLPIGPLMECQRDDRRQWDLFGGGGVAVNHPCPLSKKGKRKDNNNIKN